MPNFSKNDVVLLRYPYSDLTGSKVRPAVVVSEHHPSRDVIVVPLSSRIHKLFADEFVLSDWRAIGLTVPTAVKRGFYSCREDLIAKRIGPLEAGDAERLWKTIARRSRKSVARRSAA